MKIAAVESLNIKKGKIIVNGQKYTFKKILKEFSPKNVAKDINNIPINNHTIPAGQLRTPLNRSWDEGMEHIGANGRTHWGRGFILVNKDR